MAILGYNDYFPYSIYRPFQEKVIQEISEATALGKNSILIATNGTGKTIMALSATLPIVMSHPKRKILFCSRSRGNFYPNSDIDLLLISDEFPDDWFTRHAKLYLLKLKQIELSTYAI